MTHVTIYTKPYCPYCMRAVALLQKKGVDFTEIADAAFDPDKKKAMMDRSGGGATFPQIFIGETHVGGCDDLMALDSRGGLMPLLQGKGQPSAT